MAQRKPVKVFRIGFVSASIFGNDVENDDASRTLHSVVVQKRYVEGTGKSREVRYTSSFGLAELPQAIRVLELAQTWIEEREADVPLKE